MSSNIWCWHVTILLCFWMCCCPSFWAQLNKSEVPNEMFTFDILWFEIWEMRLKTALDVTFDTRNSDLRFEMQKGFRHPSGLPAAGPGSPEAPLGDHRAVAHPHAADLLRRPRGDGTGPNRSATNWIFYLRKKFTNIAVRFKVWRLRQRRGGWSTHFSNETIVSSVLPLVWESQPELPLMVELCFYVIFFRPEKYS